MVFVFKWLRLQLDKYLHIYFNFASRPAWPKILSSLSLKEKFADP